MAPGAACVPAVPVTAGCAVCAAAVPVRVAAADGVAVAAVVPSGSRCSSCGVDSTARAFLLTTWRQETKAAVIAILPGFCTWGGDHEMSHLRPFASSLLLYCVFSYLPSYHQGSSGATHEAVHGDRSLSLQLQLLLQSLQVPTRQHRNTCQQTYTPPCTPQRTPHSGTYTPPNAPH